jgi:thiamine-monophosphate kinase
MLKEGGGTSPEQAFVIARHISPEARLDWGLWLGSEGVGRSAADVSDGFLQDLGHIALASGCAAEVQLEDIPLSDAYRALHEGSSAPNLHDLALTGGEDFELVFTAAPDANLPARRGAIPVTRVGRLVSGESGAIRVLNADGSERRVLQAGWRHFRSKVAEDV